MNSIFLRRFQKHVVLISLHVLLTSFAAAQREFLVIPPPPYTPPETTQQVPVPLPPLNHRLRLLIISGNGSYDHDWIGVNNVLRRELQETGRFDVRVTEEFHGATDATLKGYDVVLLNYLGVWNYTDKSEDRWDPTAQKALFDFVRNGGGIVIYHSSFGLGAPSWPEFEKMAGGTMRFDKPSRRSPPLAFQVHVIDHSSVITRGMRDYFWTMDDDMYTNMRWDPNAKVHVLATAYDDAASYKPELTGPKYPPDLYTPEKVRHFENINQDNPQVWTNEFEKGRVFCITLGHGPDTLLYAGVKGLIARGAEWAASGRVTIPIEDGAQAYPLR